MGTMINLPNITPDSIAHEGESQNNKQKNFSTFDAKNYLNVRLDEENGETEKTLTIRLLPMDLTTGNPFVKVHMHNVKVPREVSKSGYKSYICLEKNKDIDHNKFGNKCPFCEINQKAYAEAQQATDPVMKKQLTDVSLANISRESVIVRCIERGKENEGVKFWKFNLRSDKTDPYNAILKLYNLKKAEGEKKGVVKNILDIYNGRDLTITITAGNSAPQITCDDDSSPLSENEEQMKAWIYDSKKWQDVFATKPYEYLAIVSQMKVPFFDKEIGKWVDKESFDKATGEKKQEEATKIEEAEKAAANLAYSEPASEPVNDFAASITVKDDDIPF